MIFRASIRSGRMRRAVAIPALTASLLAAGTATVSAATRPAAGPGGAAAASGGGQAVLGTGQAGTRSQVPWARVGPGWELVEYSASTAGDPSERGPSALYLIAPRGRWYQLYRWSARAAAPFLVDWSGDKSRALLGLDNGKLEQITLASGKVSKVSLPGSPQVLGYTRPDGASILAATISGSGEKINRYTQQGHLDRQLAKVKGQSMTALQSADGSELVIGTDAGLDLVSNAGQLIRSLPVHRSAGGCIASRYWGSGTVLASCGTKNGGGRLWLVPLNGSAPAALTPVRGSHGPDLGDIGAWKVGGGLYLQATGPCGDEFIVRQHKGGSLSVVQVPGARANDNRIISALGSRLLVQAATGCTGSISLLWFNPRTRAEQWLIRAPVTKLGVVAAVAYYSRENQHF